MSLSNFRALSRYGTVFVHSYEALVKYSFQNTLQSKLCSPVRTLHCFKPIYCSVKENRINDNNEEDKSSTENADTQYTELEKSLTEKNKVLSEEVEAFKDKYKRSLADKENLRIRLEKQIQDSKLYGIQGFCKDLLEVSDVFRKAIESVPGDKLEKGDPALTALYDGVVMTENQLLAVFKRHGLKPIVVSEGDRFDPSTQEAMFEVPHSEGKEPGLVAHVLRNGWMLHERCIRSAQVGVVKK